MSVPPEIMAALQGGGGEAPMAPPMAPPEDPAASAGSALYGGGGLPGDNTEALRSALDALQAYAQGEDDEQNIQTVLKCVTALQAILAGEEKMVDGAMGGKADPRAMRRLGGAAGAGGGPSY